MKTTTIDLNGTKLVLGPLLAATLRDHKELIVAAQRNQLEPFEMVELTVTLATAGAQRVNPAITRDDIEKLVDMENFVRVFPACWGVSVPVGGPAAKKTPVKASRSS